MLRRALPLLFTTLAAAQQELWVDPVGGSDANPGSFTQPLHTLAFAVGLAGPADAIHLLPGTYSTATNGEPFPISLGALPQQGLLVRGIGEVVIDLGGTGTTVFKMIDGATGARITNITIRNTAQTNATGSNWWTRIFSSGSGAGSGNAALDVEIDRCRFIDVNRCFVFWAADNVTGWRVHDNLFDNCANDAILEYTGTNDFYNNTFHTGAFKAYISDSGTSTFQNNLIADYSIAFENNNGGSSPAGRLEGNWLYQCTTVTQGAGFAAPLPASNTVGVDPALVNPAGGDFHLQASSPLIDAAVPISATLVADNEGNGRLVDGNNDGALQADIGCYERTPLQLTGWRDQLNQLVWLDTTSTLPGSFGVVVFGLDDGLLQIPGQGPILIDPTTYIPYLWIAPTPAQFVIPTPPLPPGTRIVAHMLGLIPGQVGSALVSGNQLWVQL